MKLVVSFICLAFTQAWLSAAEPTTGEQKPGSSQIETNSPVVPSIEVRQIKKANFSGLMKPARRVVTNQEEWEEIWNKHAASLKPAPPIPAVDFNREVVLVAAFGRKKTGGYNIEITSIRPKGKRLEVIVQERTPADDQMTIQALTAPVHFVACPIEGGEVPQFRWVTKKDRNPSSLENKRKSY